VLVREDDDQGRSTDFITRDEIRHRYVLACQAVTTSDLIGDEPAESRLTHQKRMADHVYMEKSISACFLP
jgi:hypothetical protein